MRYNTKLKRFKISDKIQDWLTDYGYGKETAKYIVNRWIESGMKNLDDSEKDALRLAKINHEYSLKE